MLRHSLKLFLKRFAKHNKKFSKEKFNEAEEFLNGDSFHKWTRTEITMTIIPKNKNEDGKDQSHKIKDAFARVSFEKYRNSCSLSYLLVSFSHFNGTCGRFYAEVNSPHF